MKNKIFTDRINKQKLRTFFMLSIFTIFVLLLVFHFSSQTSYADENYILKTGISIDKVPKEFYGSWRVTSKLISTNKEGLFKENSIDLWNLSRVGNVITLDNPFSGAHASISVDEINNKTIKFQKVGAYENGQKLTDVVQLTLNKDAFTGENYLKLDQLSEDGHVISSSKATYSLKGEKISGTSIK